MKKLKLKLTGIKVSSFVTAMDKKEEETIQGGTGNTANPVCLSVVAACVNTHPNFCTNVPSMVDACPTLQICA